MAEIEKKWLLMLDGAARRNPEEAGCGAAICDDTGSVVKELSRYIGHATNNVADYEALLIGREAFVPIGRKKVRAQSYSQLLVRQLNGEYRVKDKRLKALF